jgi:peptidoglycan/LPS O-acetylase OafA/YrhL
MEIKAEVIQNKKYFEYLDALRCLAFFAVFYAHTGTIFFGVNVSNNFPLNVWEKFAEYGSYGVNFFFVLSGFLITFLLLKEKAQTNKISIKKFYMRRILRILPVYFISLFFAMFILPLLISNDTYKIFSITNPIIDKTQFYYFLFFLGNFYNGLGIGWAALSVSVLWSVGVEEQFYLVWPWIIKWFNKRKLILLTILLISLSLLYKFIWANDRLTNYYLPWSVGMDLAFGALLGIFYFSKKQSLIIKYSLATIISSLLLIISVLAITYVNVSSLGTAIKLDTIKSSLLEIIRLVKTPMIDCLFTLIILLFLEKSTTFYTNSSKSFINFLYLARKKIKDTLIYLGKISYGLYVYHTICLMLMVQLLYKIGFLKVIVNRKKIFSFKR